MFSTFCLDAKGGAKKWRQMGTAPRVLPATHSNTPLNPYHSLTSYFIACVFTITTFSKAHSVAIPIKQQTLGAVPRFAFPEPQSYPKPTPDKALHYSGFLFL
jgi:hypothetical protein